MKPQLMSLFDRLMLQKRFVIETIFDQLKNISQIEYTRHCNVKNFIVNLIVGLVACTHQPVKPAIKLSTHERRTLATIIQSVSPKSGQIKCFIL